MVCVYCGSPTQVVNSRAQRRGNGVWRRRRCTVCAHVFTTEEHPDLSQSFMVEDTHGALSPFQRDKLFISLYEACKHREDALQAATSLTETIMGKVLKKRLRGSIAAPELARTAYAVLHAFDRTAATVYSAYHPTTSHKR